MKGGFNKILRNIVAGSADTEFEKVSTQAQALGKVNLVYELIETDEGHFPFGFQGAKGETCNL